MAAVSAALERPEDVAAKVLRRVHVSKMTRALQDRLALANVKIQNGWENLSLDAIEPQVEERLRRKRPASSNDTISDTASTTSSRLHSSHGLASSPLTEPFFSDALPPSGGSLRKKRKLISPDAPALSSSAATGRGRNRIATSHNGSWKKDHSLPQSSPTKPSRQYNTRPSLEHSSRPHSNHVAHLSMISEVSTVVDDPPSPELSEEDDADLPITSFNVNTSTRITSSPPRTPPPDRRMRKMHNVSWSRTPKTGEEGVDLLMYLATSPSPAVGNETIKPNAAQRSLLPPSTPPCKSTPLPSSHMTPGTTGNGFLGFAPVTPGTNFNFTDFVTLTPSPAQVTWQNTPAGGRTPGASARRRLNYDTQPAHLASPIMTRGGRSDGLGMELGGELTS